MAILFTIGYTIGLYYVIHKYNIGFIEIKKWPNGIVHYHLDSSLTSLDIKIIRECMNDWERETPVRFIEVKNPKFFGIIYRIYRKEIDMSKSIIECYMSSTVGYGFRASMVLTCGHSKSIIRHELGHCLGLRHEHQRPDRDKYISIQWHELTSSDYTDFCIINPNEFLYDYTKYPYDFNSIMHYNYNIICKPKYSKCKLRNSFMTKLDIKKVKEIYEKK